MAQPFDITLGKEACVEKTVGKEHTAKVFASGALEVFATPCMIAMMEEASTHAIALPEGYTTVGTQMSAEHLSATPVGMKVRAAAKIIGVEGRKVTLSVEAYDEAGLIGRGTHERFIVETEKFLGKTYNKLNKK